MRKGLRPVEVIAIVGVVLILAAIMYPVRAGGGPAPTTACIVNLKQLAIGAIMYADDNDGRAMPASSWIDSANPYIKTEAIYTCPVVLAQSKSYGYAMNRFLSTQNIEKLKDPDKAHLIYESTVLLRNANEYFPSFPIPGRHAGKNTVAFADGHARAIVMDVPKS